MSKRLITVQLTERQALLVANAMDNFDDSTSRLRDEAFVIRNKFRVAIYQWRLANANRR